MLFRSFRGLSGLVLLFLTAHALTAGGPQRRKKNEPATQVLPLPPELPTALSAQTTGLQFLLVVPERVGGLSVQIRSALNSLIRSTRGETIVKVRAFVAGAGDTRRFQALLTDLFSEHKLALPVVSILQVGALAKPSANVVLEAVVATGKQLNPDGLAFLSGHQGHTVVEALGDIQNSLTALGLAPDHLLRCTCFTSDIQAASAPAAPFDVSVVNIVQALRDPAERGTTCEAVARLTADSKPGRVSELKDAGGTATASPQLIFTGLQLTFGNYLDDAKEAYGRLQRGAQSISPASTPVSVRAFAIDDAAASALRKMIPLGPALLTTQPVEGLPGVEATGGIEAILAPGTR